MGTPVPFFDEGSLGLDEIDVRSDLPDADGEAPVSQVEEGDSRETPHGVGAGLAAEVAKDRVEDARFAATSKQLLVHAASHQFAIVDHHN